MYTTLKCVNSNSATKAESPGEQPVSAADLAGHRKSANVVEGCMDTVEMLHARASGCVAASLQGIASDYRTAEGYLAQDCATLLRNGADALHASQTPNVRESSARTPRDVRLLSLRRYRGGRAANTVQRPSQRWQASSMRWVFCSSFHSFSLPLQLSSSPSRIQGTRAKGGLQSAGRACLPGIRVQPV